MPHCYTGVSLTLNWVWCIIFVVVESLNFFFVENSSNFSSLGHHQLFSSGAKRFTFKNYICIVNHILTFHPCEVLFLVSNPLKSMNILFQTRLGFLFVTCWFSSGLHMVNIQQTGSCRDIFCLTLSNNRVSTSWNSLVYAYWGLWRVIKLLKLYALQFC